MTSIVYDNPIPRPLRAIGAKWRDGKRSFRMSWGELSFGRGGFALGLALLGDRPHFSLNLHAFWVALWVTLPFLRRFAYNPTDMMDQWGVSYATVDGVLFLNWGPRSKLITMPWRDWSRVEFDIRRADGSWVPKIWSYQTNEPPDQREIFKEPYRYMTQDGERQEVTATFYVERSIRRLRWLSWTRRFQQVTYNIWVDFSDEVGEGRGSWKGGTVGCGYDLKPGETPTECLRRMQRDRRFSR